MARYQKADLTLERTLVNQETVLALVRGLLIVPPCTVLALAATIGPGTQLACAPEQRRASLRYLLRGAKNGGLIVTQAGSELKIFEFSAGAQLIFDCGRDDVISESVRLRYPAPSEEAFARAAGWGIRTAISRARLRWYGGMARYFPRLPSWSRCTMTTGSRLVPWAW